VTLTEQINDRLWSFLRDEIDVSDAPGGLVECSTLLSYSDGDAVTVWVESDAEGNIAVSDFSEAWMRIVGRGREKSQRQRAVVVCEQRGLVFSAGRVTGVGRLWRAGDLILRVAEASARITDTGDSQMDVEAEGESTRSAGGFRKLVTDTFRQRKVNFGTNKPITGASGKKHKVPIFLPDQELLVAPMPAHAPGSMLSSVFMRFSDIGAVNGYETLAILDDRDEEPPAETVNLLAQVGSTALWSQRQDWIPEVLRGS